VQARASLSPLIWLEKALSGRANQDTQDDVWSVNVLRKKQRGKWNKENEETESRRVSKWFSVDLTTPYEDYG